MYGGLEIDVLSVTEGKRGGQLSVEATKDGNFPFLPT
jgi:hypothetical protein